MNNPAVVFDACTALSSAFQNETYHQRVMTLIADLAKENVIIYAPSIFAYECDSVVRLKVHTGKVGEGGRK